MTRFWQVDAARGLAVVMMIASNFVTDLQYFGHFDGGAFWQYFALATGALFVFIAGFSLELARRHGKTTREFAKRGIVLLLLGFLITLVTWWFIPKDFVRWGVLHLLGASILLAQPLAKMGRELLLVLGLLLIAGGVLAGEMAASSDGFAFLGFKSAGFSSVDYFPLLPWFGVFLLGIFAAKSFELKESSPRAGWMGWLGRNSLAVYMVHQPVLLLVVFLLFGFPSFLQF
ncbi:MAG TPA: heparan-alpha-glucosaminide N-acetyltransferase [Candidatus Norongarragalinales archaeon]|jgi:uncharacterized membrane protein|nr:heparan-alpha-glucosaminide N-acetyltransferase [Candidatus Norongarragalinales archaeon]